MEHSKNKMLKKNIKFIPLAMGALIMTGCAITPVKVKNDVQLNNTYKGLHNILRQQQPINRRITLSEAIARTLKYNLAHKVKQAQIMLESGNLKAAYLEMLPTANVGTRYSFRNNDHIQNLTGSGESVTPREILTQSYGLQWNLLDLGLSYTRAQQQANRVMIAEEERRKITQQLVQEVVSAYWKAWTAQSLAGKISKFKHKAELALKRSKKIGKEKANTPQIEFDYQKVLIESIRRVNKLQAQISDAKHNLARLMNIAPNSKFALSNPGTSLRDLPRVRPQFKKMDTLALIYRPELRQASYESQIAKKGIQSAIVSMLPGIDFNFGYNVTNNKFVQHQSWWGGNVGASLNLIQTLLSGPYRISLANKKHSFEQLKQIATTVTVLTQIRVAYTHYLTWREDANYAAQESKVSKLLYNNAAKLEQANQGNEQITIRRGIDAITSQFDKDISLAKAHEALSKLYQSIGLDVLSPEARYLPLNVLQQKVKAMLNLKNTGGFNQEINRAYNKVKPTLDKIKANMAKENAAKLAKQKAQSK